MFQTTLPARQAQLGQLDRPLPPAIAGKVTAELWSHQAEAINLARAGRSVVVATGTSSGKSLCYQVPIAEAARGTPGRRGTAIMVFPTKALARDQLRSLTAMELPGVVAGAYDGDAGRDERAWVRRHANVVATNPEMLHSGLLPHHERWVRLLGNLAYVVIDELHAFRGVFGSHLAHVLRRLHRLARHHGSDPRFVCTSGTIGEPGRLAEALCGVPFDVVSDDGAPRSERTITIYNPQADRADPRRRGRRSAPRHRVTAQAMAQRVTDGGCAITFCRSRRATELIAAQVQGSLPVEARGRVLPYRGGYLAEERREIEEALFSGQLDGVVATSALELGIDVGTLDTVILDGFPGTIASFWQQAGRAGRAGQPAEVVLVAGDDQLDQWCAQHPEKLLSRPPEPVVINPANTLVSDAHLRCAAQELPLTHADERYWPGLLEDAVRRLVLDDQLGVRQRRSGPQALYTGGGWPTHEVTLRAGSGNPVQVRSVDDVPVGTVDVGRACSQVHEGASYLHAGAHWRVVTLDLDERVAVVAPDDGSTYTVPRTKVELEVLGTDQRRRLTSPEVTGGVEVGLGPVRVTQQVVGYQRKEVATGLVIASEALSLPPTILTTRGFWYAFDDSLLDGAGVVGQQVPGALHAMEHAGIGVLPLFAICDRWDVGGVSTAHQNDLERAAIVIYDGYEGGAGVAELGYEAVDRHLATTLEVVEGCPCESGCPSCVQSPKCGNGNDPLDKAGAAALLRAVSALASPTASASVTAQPACSPTLAA